TTVVGAASAGSFRTTARPAGDAAGRPAGTARPSRGRRGTVSPNRAAPGTEPAGCTARARPGEPSPERGGEGGARGAGRAGRHAPPPVRPAARPAGTARPPRARGAGHGGRPSRDPHRAAAPTAPPESRTTPYGQGVPMTEERLDGVIVATALPYAEDPAAPAGLRVDLDRYAEHCRWLVESGCRGVGPNGSLGEYSSLTAEERRAVARTAIEAVGGDGVVVVGVHGVGAHQAREWAEKAAEDGADGVLCLPPTMYRANDAEVVHHFEQVAAVGLPVMAYNNPIDTKVDMEPALVAEIAAIDNVVAVKEFSGDVRRVLELRERAPGLNVVAGADDVALEA